MKRCGNCARNTGHTYCHQMLKVQPLTVWHRVGVVLFGCKFWWTRGLSHLEIDSNKHPRPEPMYICQGEKCMGKKIYYTEGIAGTGSQENRQKERSRTFPGIAAAMAEQWGDLK